MDDIMSGSNNSAEDDKLTLHAVPLPEATKKAREALRGERRKLTSEDLAQQMRDKRRSEQLGIFPTIFRRKRD